MELTRRDAVAALAAAGVAVGGGGAAYLASREGDGGPAAGPATNEGSPARSAAEGSPDSGPLGEAELDVLVAAAEVFYPSAVSGIETFVSAFVRGRAADRPDRARAQAAAVTALDDYARGWYDAGFADLDAETRDRALRAMSVDTVDADPDGEDDQRVRYYVRNELLFALYTSPTGGELVGLENPQGHPGGTASYQRGPES